MEKQSNSRSCLLLLLVLTVRQSLVSPPVPVLTISVIFSSFFFCSSSDAFSMLLDKYTSLGVYVIHHSFTLAELFTISGLQLVSNTLTAGIRVSVISPQKNLLPYAFVEEIFLGISLHTFTDAPTDTQTPRPLLQPQQTGGKKGGMPHTNLLGHPD